MLNIAICDDNRSEREELLNKVNIYINDSDLKANIIEFQDGEDLLEYINSEKTFFDIVFLDIYMGFLNGMDTAKKIRDIDNSCKIIFVTSSSSHAVESYAVRASYYIVKPIEEENLHKALQVSINFIHKENSQYILIKNNNSFYKLLHKDIIYVESMARVLLIHTKNNGIINVYNKLNDFEAQLNDSRFVRCHKSFLINLDNASEIKYTFFIMDNDDRVPISKSVKDIKKIYMGYLINKL